MTFGQLATVVVTHYDEFMFFQPNQGCYACIVPIGPPQPVRPTLLAYTYPPQSHPTPPLGLILTTPIPLSPQPPIPGGTKTFANLSKHSEKHTLKKIPLCFTAFQGF